MRSLTSFAVPFVLVALTGCQCVPSDLAGDDGGLAGGSGGAGGAGSCSASVPCPAPRVCTVIGQCVDPDAACADDSQCEAGKLCSSTSHTCVAGGACGSQRVQPQAVPGNLLIVLDRSCSMRGLVGAGVTKWDAAVAALTRLT